MKKLLCLVFICILSGQSKVDLLSEKMSNALPRDYSDRKRSVLDQNNLALRLSNAATYGYDRWGLNHEFPIGSITQNGCCTYYWTASPIIGGLINGQPSFANGVRGSYRDSEEEFEPLPGYDAGFEDYLFNIGIALSDIPDSWPDQWPIEIDVSGTFNSPIYDENGDIVDTLSFPGIENQLDSEQDESQGLRFPGSDNGLVRADREAYFVVTDNDPLEGNTFESNGGTGPLNVRVDVWALQFEEDPYDDFIVFKQVFTNVGPSAINDAYIGITGDPDVPEQGAAEWTDDLALFIENDDPLIAEKLIDTTDAHLLGNLAIVYDADDISIGFIESDVGWIGIKFLETKHITNDGETNLFDISAFQTYAYTDDATSDADAYYNQLANGIENPDHISPHPTDTFNKPYTYGPDITWVIASGPIDLAPGERVEFVFGDVLGESETDLLNNVRSLSGLFECGFKLHQVDVLYPNGGETVDAHVEILWQAESATDESIDYVDIYYSADNGDNWTIIETNTENSGSYQWDTNVLIDGLFYKVKIIGTDGNCYGSGESEQYFTINNPGNGPPFVELLYPDSDETFSNEITLSWNALDPDNDEISISLYHKAVGNNDWELIASNLADNGSYLWQTNYYSNGNGNIKIIASDGEFAHEDVSPQFYLWNEGEFLDIHHISGISNSPISVRVVDENSIDNSTFQITINDDFDAIDDTTKSYSLFNLTNESMIFEEYDNFSSESPEFHGLRLKISDFGDINVQPHSESGWISSESNWSFSGTIVDNTIQDYNTYHIIMSEDSTDIMDCTSGQLWDCDNICFNQSLLEFILGDGWCEDGSFGINLACELYNYDNGDCDTLSTYDQPNQNTQTRNYKLPIEIWNMTDMERLDFVYLSACGGYYSDNNIYCDNDLLYTFVQIFFPTAEGPLASWNFYFDDNDLDTNSLISPEIGDTYELIPFIPHQSQDIYQFSASDLEIKNMDVVQPFALDLTYPNPFNPVTNINFALKKSININLAVYDILGKKIDVLADGYFKLGEHNIKWNAEKFPSGVYFVKLIVDDPSNISRQRFTQTQKLILLK